MKMNFNYIAEFLGVENYVSELNTLDGIWTSRVSSHISLKEVPDYITKERINEAVYLIDRTLKRSGMARPRLSVAALNPHAGDNGNFGTERKLILLRQLSRHLQAQQVNVDGPWPSDTVFPESQSKGKLMVLLRCIMIRVR